VFRTSSCVCVSFGFLACVPLAEGPAPETAKLVPASFVAPPPEPPPAPSAEGEPEPDPSAPFEVGQTCADPHSPICTPPSRVAEELCRRGSQDLALGMFQGGTPWRRAFVRHNLDAWYTGARHAAPAPLEQGEEVLIITNRTASGSGVQVGSGNYDVYRWNGSCASVMADEVSFDKPRFPKTAPIAWERLDDATQNGLLGDRAIQLRKDQVKKACREDGTAPDCTTAREALTALIAKRVRNGSTR
jgi:hypothetical protein